MCEQVSELYIRREGGVGPRATETSRLNTVILMTRAARLEQADC